MLMTIQPGQAETRRMAQAASFMIALVEYLQVKLKRAKADKSTVRVVMLSSWIVEVMVRITEASATSIFSDRPTSTSPKGFSSTITKF